MGRIRDLGLLFALIVAPASAAAQVRPGGVILGVTVAGDTGAPLAGAGVAVRSAADSAVVAGDLTDASGGFAVRDVSPGRYFVEVTYLGYSSVSTPVVTLASATDTVNLGTLRLAVQAIALERVAVEAERSPVTFAPDRIIYSTADMAASAGGVATDLLQSMPELEVDIDGSVSLRGSSPRIHINGRPAPMEGEALSLFLEQLPAELIERVEVIPDPSARFDAEGAGGIVNIVLRDDVELGVSGSAFANAGTRGTLGGGARLTYQRGPLTLAGGGSLRHSSEESSDYDLRQNLVAEPTTFLRQDSWSQRGRLSGNVDFKAELELGERTQLWTEARLFDRGSDSDRSTTTTYMDAVQEPTARYDRLSGSESDGSSADVAAGVRYTIEPRRHELTAELEVESGRDAGHERVERWTDATIAGTELEPVELTIEDEGEDDREATFRLDYTRPWGDEGRIEVGYRGELEETEERRLRTLVPDAADPTNAEETRSGFTHREVFNALYLTLGRSLGGLQVQLGLRAERADTRFELPTGEAFENDYASFFPSVNIAYALADGRRLRLSYSRRIRRPSSRVLNPTDRSTDPLNRRVGNPDIEPEYTHSLSLDASWTGTLGTLRLSPYYRRSTNNWVQISRVDADGVSTRTWENLASTDAYGASVTASLRPIDGWSGSMSVSARREDRDAGDVARNYSGAALVVSTRANVSARLTPSLSIQTTVSYSPARDVPEGRIGSRLMSNLAVRQRFWDRRASVNLRIQDPFDLFDSSFETRDPTYVQIGRSDLSRRSAVLSFSYSFGGGRSGRRDGGNGPGGRDRR